MGKLLSFIRDSRMATVVAGVLIALLAFAPVALSRTSPFQQAQVAGQVIDKDDCKNGGWRTYNVFENQGDCVSYVATGGRNQQAGPTTTTTLRPTTTTTLAPTTTTAAGNRPATKDACKNDGWRRYGVFNNQGDCVSWIETGGRNQPAGPTTTTTLSPTTTTTLAPTTTTAAGNRPATKDDCKKDGWQRFGVFKNQGDCVSWVATGGSNLPAGP